MEYLAIEKMKEINQTMFMDRKIPYCQDISSSQLGLQIHCNLNQNTTKLFCGYQQLFLKFICKCKRWRIASSILKKQNKARELLLI